MNRRLKIKTVNGKYLIIALILISSTSSMKFLSSFFKMHKNNSSHLIKQLHSGYLICNKKLKIINVHFSNKIFVLKPLYIPQNKGLYFEEENIYISNYNKLNWIETILNKLLSYNTNIYKNLEKLIQERLDLLTELLEKNIFEDKEIELTGYMLNKKAYVITEFQLDALKKNFKELQALIANFEYRVCANFRVNDFEEHLELSYTYDHINTLLEKFLKKLTDVNIVQKNSSRNLYI